MYEVAMCTECMYVSKYIHANKHSAIREVSGCAIYLLILLDATKYINMLAMNAQIVAWKNFTN